MQLCRHRDLSSYHILRGRRKVSRCHEFKILPRKGGQINATQVGNVSSDVRHFVKSQYSDIFASSGVCWPLASDFICRINLSEEPDEEWDSSPSPPAATHHP